MTFALCTSSLVKKVQHYILLCILYTCANISLTVENLFFFPSNLTVSKGKREKKKNGQKSVGLEIAVRQKETDEEYGKPRVPRYTSGEGLSKNRGLEVGN